MNDENRKFWQQLNADIEIGLNFLFIAKEHIEKYSPPVEEARTAVKEWVEYCRNSKDLYAKE